jgi:hypothetical protein
MNLESSSLSIMELESRMRPGALSQKGFLGKDDRLEEVLSHDAQMLAQLGVTYEEIACRLEALIKVAEAAPGHTTQIDYFKVKVSLYTGFQICPWSPDIHHAQCTAGGGVRHGSIDWCIHNLRSGQEMCGPGLIIHLIRAHKFFEGFESPYRVDPRELASLLELGPFGK